MKITYNADKIESPIEQYECRFNTMRSLNAGSWFSFYVDNMWNDPYISYGVYNEMITYGIRF